MKNCFKCNTLKETSEFYKNKARLDGLQVYCKLCMKIENKKNYVNHKESWDLRTKEYGKTEKNKKYRREWAKNKYLNDEEHRKKIIKNVVIYEKNKLLNDDYFKIKHRLRSRIRDALKRKNSVKSKTTIELLGCSKQEFINYFESKFTEGMTWDKVGKEIHIDHIKPCAKFDLTKKEEQEKCFHYTNLQPLGACDNLIKGSKYD